MFKFFTNRTRALKDMYGIMAVCLLTALFFVNFMWGFFDEGPFALGFNMTVLLSLGYLLFYLSFPGKQLFAKANLAWLAPFGLIALSFSLYDNPFLKMFSILVIPPAFIVVYNFIQLADRERRQWDRAFFSGLIMRAIRVLLQVPKAVGMYGDVAFPAERKGLVVAKKVLIGMLLLAAMAFIVVIPLLSNADPLFAAKMDAVFSVFDGLISLSFIGKAIFFGVMSVFLLAMSLAWLQPFELAKSSRDENRVDPIIAGIVLGGILLLYSLFLYLQLSRLWVNDLPIDFRETEGLVKSGFWQLFVLSVINILLFSFCFRKTNSLVQKILAAFVGASSLLLLSAGHRMYLYVTNYGFSYEKFFAAYTVAFIGILFIWIASRFFREAKPNIVKFSAMLFLWMFALATVLPVEQLILRANVAMAEQPNSRIKIFELTMLSPDVLGSIEKYVSRDAVRCQALKGTDQAVDTVFCGWEDWLKDRRAIVERKKWHELNVTNLSYLLGRKNP